MDGQTSCHQCILEKKMASRIAGRMGDTPPQHRLCGTCNEVLPHSEFVPNKAGIDGLYSICRKCCALRSKKQRSCPAYKQRIKSIGQNYARHNKGKLNARSARRRAVRVQATVDFGDKEFEDFFIQEIFNLAVIRETTTGIKWEVDHMVPLISDFVCGLHWSSNLQLLTAFDNRSKSNNYWPDMWQTTQGEL